MLYLNEGLVQDLWWSWERKDLGELFS